MWLLEGTGNDLGKVGRQEASLPSWPELCMISSATTSDGRRRRGFGIQNPGDVI